MLIFSEELLTGSVPSVWLRWPFLIVCEHDALRIFEYGENALHLHSELSLSLYAGGAALASGRGAQVLQSVDVRGDWLAGGTSKGLVIALSLKGPKLATDAALTAVECLGHTKACP